MLEKLKKRFKYHEIPDDIFLRYVTQSFRKLKKRYSYICTMNVELLIILSTFSIMIFENFNRPWYLRLFEYIIFVSQKLMGRHSIVMSLGIMQVQVSHFITSGDSIYLAIDKISCIYLDAITENSYSNEAEIVEIIALKYNPSSLYVRQIRKIYEVISLGG